MRYLYTDMTDAFPYTPTSEDMQEYSEFLDSLEEGEEEMTPKEAELCHLLADGFITPEEFQAMVW